MELRLQQFIDSVEVLADIRNLDTFNPIIFQLENPVTATRYTVVGSKTEPSYLGIPINTTWIVLDPQSPYFRMALKLVDVNNPDQATTLPTVTDSEGVLQFYWNIIRTYDEIFSVPQYYSNAGKGPKGDKGDDGLDGAVDYNLALAAIAGLTGTLVIDGATPLAENSVQQFSLTLTEPQVLADGTVTAPQSRQVVAPIFLVGQAPAGTYIDSNNVLHVGDLLQDAEVSLYATYPSWARSAIATLQVPLQNVAASVVGISMSGMANVSSGGQAQYTIDALWSDGTTTHPQGTWALDATGFGSIDQNGLLSVPNTISSSGSVNVSAEVVINGITYMPNMTVVVTKVVVAATVVSVSVTGATAVDSSSQSQYTAAILWSDGTTTNPTAVWSLNTAVFGTIGSASGLLNVPSTISSSGSVTVKATFSVAGVTYQPTLVVAVTKIVVAPTVTGVVITGSSSVINNSNTTYTLTASWSNGTTTNPAASSWSLDVADFGTISAGGTLSVPDTILASGAVTITANVTIGGTLYSPTKTVTVTLVVPSLETPHYGIGPVTQASWATFIQGMPSAPALTPDGKYQVSIDCIGQTSFQYFAYPQSHGEATFYDKLSQFFGGFGGAGNATSGPSAQTLSNFKDMPIVVDVAGTPYYLYRSDFANLGAAAGNQWEITLAIP